MEGFSESGRIHKFTIIRRKDLGYTRHHHAIDFSERNYRVPLVGCANFEDSSLQVGDIVGVVLKSSIREHCRFQIASSLLTEEDLQKRRIIGSFYRQEEHFYEITKVLKQSRYQVIPRFLDHNKVIRKEIQESFERDLRVLTKDIIPHHLLEDLIFASPLPENVIREPLLSLLKSTKDSWEIFSNRKVELFQENFELLLAQEKAVLEHSNDISNSDQSKPISAEIIYKKFFPYHNFDRTLIDLSNETNRQSLQAFSSYWEMHQENILRLFGEEVFTKLGGILNNSSNAKNEYHSIYHRMDCNMQGLYRLVFSSLPDRITLRFTHQLYRPCALETPKIYSKSPITTLKMSQIFRVYRSDPRYCMRKCTSVTNWSGVHLPLTIRSELAPGDHVRVVITDRALEKESSKWNDRVIYFQILWKLNDTKYLAALENRYLSEYEDIVVTIDSSCISEIPLDWSENPAFKKYLTLDGELTGYAMTGNMAMEKTSELISFDNQLPFA